MGLLELIVETLPRCLVVRAGRLAGLDVEALIRYVTEEAPDAE